MFQGEVCANGADGLCIRSADLGCTVRAERAAGSAQGASVWAAIRPEKIQIARDPAAGAAAVPAENLVAGTVREIAYMGDTSIYLVQLDSGSMLRVTLPNVLRGAERPIAREERVWLSWHGSSPVVLTE
jgi:putrescine transport system ATP-binding protein